MERVYMRQITKRIMLSESCNAASLHYSRGVSARK